MVINLTLLLVTTKELRDIKIMDTALKMQSLQLDYITYDPEKHSPMFLDKYETFDGHEKAAAAWNRRQEAEQS